MTLERLHLIAVFLVVIGCRPSANPPSVPKPNDPDAAVALRLLVIDDPDLARAIERQWTAHGESPLKVRLVSQKEFLEQEQRRLAADVVIYPSAMIGELASRDWLRPLDDEHAGKADFQWRDVWELPRLHEVKWGSSTLAVPLGSPTLMLCYRPDLFEHLQLAVPKTWTEYQAAILRLAQYQELKSLVQISEKQWRGHCEPIGAGWAGELLLARSAAYARHPSQFSTMFDYRDMKPLIDGPPFVRALEELVATQLPADRSDAEWQETLKLENVEFARKLLLEGKCALAVTWPGTLAAEELKSINFPIAFAPLPGSAEAYNFRTAAWDQRTGNETSSVPILGVSGRLASVAEECRNATAATNLLLFIAGPELSSQISPASKQTTLFRESHLRHVDRWLGAQYGQEATQRYGERAQQIFNQTTCLLTLRIPGRQRYLRALDEAVGASLTKKAAPKDALRAVAEQWESITNELGRDAQRRAYTQSIGLE